MDQVCFVIPIADDKVENGRRLLREVQQDRLDDLAACDRRIGISKEVWFLTPLPNGSALTVYLECDNAVDAMRQFYESDEEFDIWLREGLADLVGLDPNTPPPEPYPERLVSYSA
jgi:hypothetical protein